ncbi:uncharacterized protein LOC129732075 [Wyeomyia smithii]|uniref:uncharacterized protein LOC129732075 n=1 Tax=Wyeomyia smithii TaxID=174621 RepID=UPI00246815C1|nr:uncharacterized protein LOC129732075 [Wyeomyia smithii]
MDRKMRSDDQPELSSYEAESVMNDTYFRSFDRGYVHQSDSLGRVIYRTGNPQRDQQLRSNPQISGSPAMSFYSSTESCRSTPSPDFALSTCHTSSPLCAVYQQGNPPRLLPTKDTVPPLNYFHNIEDVKMAIKSEHSFPDHDYTFSSAPSTISSDTRSVSRSPGLDRPVVDGRTSSDSGNSTMPDDINPLCMNDWYRDLLKTEYTERLQKEMATILHRSDVQKQQFLAAKMQELPSDLEYNPNKSRLRKVYDDPSEAADRERNNLASRRSRFKKKIAQQITNMHLEFDRNENAQLYVIQNWIGKIVFELESKWLDSGASPDELYELRHLCGFPQNPSDRGYASARY